MEIRCAIKTVIRVKHPFPTIDDILISDQGSTSFSKLGLTNGFYQLELFLGSHSITIFQTEKKKKTSQDTSVVYSSKEELHYALREIFPGIKRVEILQTILLPILRRDFIPIRLEWYYVKPQEMFIF